MIVKYVVLKTLTIQYICWQWFDTLFSKRKGSNCYVIRIHFFVLRLNIHQNNFLTRFFKTSYNRKIRFLFCFVALLTKLFLTLYLRYFNDLFVLSLDNEQQTKLSMHLMISVSSAITSGKISNNFVNAFDHISIECNVFNNKKNRQCIW